MLPVRACLYALLPMLVGLSPFSKPAQAQDVVTTNEGRAVPEDNLAYPVLLVLKTRVATSQASGFFVDTPHAQYLVTAHHFLAEQDALIRDPKTNAYVTDANITVISYSRDPTDNTRNNYVLNLHDLQANGHIKINQSVDILVITLIELSGPPSSDKPVSGTPVAGVNILQIAKQGTVGVALNAIKKFDDVLIGNDVLMYGYPTSIGLATLPQIIPDRPLLRKGIVAGKNFQQHTLILDCPSYQGNSGGPVFEIDRRFTGNAFYLIGVAEQYVPYAMGSPTISILNNSGYSIAAPTDAVVEMIGDIEKPK
jgi:Trypsin-like peptidase domain